MELKDVFFSTGIKWANGPLYCRQLPELENTELALWDTV
jgi:hypothetical protein